jgi:hypothetical protein
VRFEQANFQPRGRLIVWKSDHDPKYPSYTAAFKAGKKFTPFVGHDGGDTSISPTKELMMSTGELISLSVTVDGRKWSIPKRAYGDLLNPNLDKQHDTATLSRDGKSLAVKMENSDGAGSYNVRWIFRRNGTYSRRVELEHD